MKRISEHTLEQVRSNADIVQTVSDYVILERKGGRYLGLCPFHNEKTASFTVNPDKGFFYCFGCKKGGDAISFIMEIESCSYIEAIERLARKTGTEIVYEGHGNTEDFEKIKQKNSLLELYDRLGKTFSHILLNEQMAGSALEYAMERIGGRELIIDFRIGYAPKDRYWLYNFLSSRGYSDEFLARSGLFSARYPRVSIFSDRLLFPVMNDRGDLVAFSGRLLGGEGPKYINSPETEIYKKQEILFALNFAKDEMRKQSLAVLCEGNMDVLAFHSAGVKNTVAPLGTAFTARQASLLKRYAREVVLAFDGDDAGIKATEKAIFIAERAGLKVSVLVLPDKIDPADYLKEFGNKQLKKLMESTITSEEFLLKIALSIHRESGQMAAFTYLFQQGIEMDSEIRRDAFFDAAAAKLLADPASVRADYTRFLQNQRKPPQKRQRGSENGKPSFERGPDAEFLAALIANIELFPGVRSSIGARDFSDPVLKDAFISLEESFRNEETNPGSLCLSLRDEDFRTFVMERLASSRYQENADKFIQDGVYRLKIRSLEAEQRILIQKIRDFDSERDGEVYSMNDLLYEKMYYDNEIAKLKEERDGAN